MNESTTPATIIIAKDIFHKYTHYFRPDGLRFNYMAVKVGTDFDLACRLRDRQARRFMLSISDQRCTCCKGPILGPQGALDSNEYLKDIEVCEVHYSAYRYQPETGNWENVGPFPCLNSMLCRVCQALRRDGDCNFQHCIERDGSITQDRQSDTEESLANMLKHLEATREQMEPCELRRLRQEKKDNPEIMLPHLFTCTEYSLDDYEFLEEEECDCCLETIEEGELRMYCSYPAEDGSDEICGAIRCYRNCLLEDEYYPERGLCQPLRGNKHPFSPPPIPATVLVTTLNIRQHYHSINQTHPDIASFTNPGLHPLGTSKMSRQSSTSNQLLSTLLIFLYIASTQALVLTSDLSFELNKRNTTVIAGGGAVVTSNKGNAKGGASNAKKLAANKGFRKVMGYVIAIAVVVCCIITGICCACCKAQIRRRRERKRLRDEEDEKVAQGRRDSYCTVENPS
ncbi:hypothetical protein BJ508DRAFT_328309 [Ascobolus immersus RN42]|uniref:Uncharacterized protein n=1 Tax=Ascobolus immersus RN42 TaxID=1160509 RepID=A0A3N4I3Z7_ASCIM|nr:hypothetical protein BJ508DRAFT_328309 [Ascobolus immersus RN42]